MYPLKVCASRKWIKLKVLESETEFVLAFC